MKGVKSAEFILAVVVAILLVGSLLSQKYLKLPHQFVSVLLLVYIGIRIYDIVKCGGTIIEDYASLLILIIFGIIHYISGEDINVVIIVFLVFVLIYSVGLVPWVNDIIKSRKIVLFIASYIFFIVTIIFLFAGIYFSNAEFFSLNGEDIELNFENTLYFSTTTFTTVGYGDIAPTGFNKLVASIESVVGVALNISFIGYILASNRFKRH